jgi:hypothetical protein
MRYSIHNYNNVSEDCAHVTTTGLSRVRRNGFLVFSRTRPHFTDWWYGNAELITGRIEETDVVTRSMGHWSPLAGTDRRGMCEIFEKVVRIIKIMCIIRARTGNGKLNRFCEWLHAVTFRLSASLLRALSLFFYTHTHTHTHTHIYIYIYILRVNFKTKRRPLRLVITNTYHVNIIIILFYYTIPATVYYCLFPLFLVFFLFHYLVVVYSVRFPNRCYKIILSM